MNRRRFLIGAGTLPVVAVLPKMVPEIAAPTGTAEAITTGLWMINGQITALQILSSTRILNEVFAGVAEQVNALDK